MEKIRNTTKGILQSINTPLGFYVLALLIVESFLGIVLIQGNLEAHVRAQGMWAGVGLYLFLVGMVSLFCWYKPNHLIFTELGILVEMGKATYGTDVREVPPEEMPKGEPLNQQED